jgi:hypothetical protein
MRVVELARAWTDAVNAKDVSGLQQIAAPDIAIVGPRGTARGHAVLAQWLERAGASFRTERLFARDGVAVVEQTGTWLSEETAQQPSRAIVVIVLHEQGGQVVSFARSDDLHVALQAEGLSLAEEVPAVA